VKRTRTLIWVWIVVILALLWTDIGLAFQNEPEGFRGLKWGDAPTEDMEFLGEQAQRRTYFRFNDELKMEQVPLQAIIYLFYGEPEKLYMVQLYFNGRDNYENLKTICRAGFGKETGGWTDDTHWISPKTKVFLIFWHGKGRGELHLASGPLSQRYFDAGKKKRAVEGWDKAKFRMSPEELRSAYAEEERSNLDTFWEEEEDISSDTPYTLSTSELTVFGHKRKASFYFVDNKLFTIELRVRDTKFPHSKSSKRWIEELTEVFKEVTKEYENLENLLINKHGDTFAEEGGTKNWRRSVWTDEKGNLAILTLWFELGTLGGLSRWLTKIIYHDAELRRLWELNMEEWKELIKTG